MRALVIFALTVAALSSRAQYGTSSEVSKNYKIIAGIALDAPFGPATEGGTKISGASVNFHLAGSVASVEYSGPDPWTNAQIESLERKVTGDPRARLKNVYTQNAAEEAYVEISNKWMLWFP